MSSACDELAAPVLADPDAQLRRHYNAAPFMFPHGLAGHPLFELPSLAALVARMPDHRDTYWSNGKAGLTDRWEESRDGKRSLADTIAGIAGNNSLIIIKNTEQDPLYATVLQPLLDRIIELSGEPMRRDNLKGEVLILISSPGRLTPYHIDAEANFLFQVTGSKTLYVFDHTDRDLLTDRQREQFVAGDFNGAIYREDKQAAAARFELLAGHAVHIPVFAPHWVQNHGNVSVALSVNYELRSVKRREKIYGINRRLRRLGLAPVPPGRSGWRDGLKLASAQGLDTLGQLKGGAARRLAAR